MCCVGGRESPPIWWEGLAQPIWWEGLAQPIWWEGLELLTWWEGLAQPIWWEGLELLTWWEVISHGQTCFFPPFYNDADVKEGRNRSGNTKLARWEGLARPTHLDHCWMQAAHQCCWPQGFQSEPQDKLL